MADFKIYGVPPSSFTRTVRLACHEKGIDYELVPMFPGQMGALNPFQKIPAIAHGDMTNRPPSCAISIAPSLAPDFGRRTRVRRRSATSG